MTFVVAAPPVIEAQSTLAGDKPGAVRAELLEEKRESATDSLRFIAGLWCGAMRNCARR